MAACQSPGLACKQINTGETGNICDVRRAFRPRDERGARRERRGARGAGARRHLGPRRQRDADPKAGRDPGGLGAGGPIGTQTETCLTAEDRARVAEGIARYEQLYGPVSQADAALGVPPLYPFYPMGGTLFRDLWVNNFVDHLKKSRKKKVLKTYRKYYSFLGLGLYLNH